MQGPGLVCTDINVARTCSTFPSSGRFCAAIADYPPVTIDDYGSISGSDAESLCQRPHLLWHRRVGRLGISVGHRGPQGLLRNGRPRHQRSRLGQGERPAALDRRNSWGEYWGEMGCIRVAFGNEKVEQQCAWAAVKDYTAPEKKNPVHCFEDGGSCKVKRRRARPGREKVVDRRAGFAQGGEEGAAQRDHPEGACDW